MSLRAKMAIHTAKSRVQQLRPPDPVPTPPAREFRPITPDPYRVRIPKIKKVRSQSRVVEPSTKILLVLPIREKNELREAANELGVSLNTILRLSYKRFLRMPELPLTEKQMQLWQLGVQRNRKVWRQKDRLALRDELLKEMDARDVLSLQHLEHKAVEVFATNGYRKTQRMAFTPGARKGKVGNPSGRNGRTRRDDSVSPVSDHDAGVGRGASSHDSDGSDNETAARPVRLVTAPRRLMIKPKG